MIIVLICLCMISCNTKPRPDAVILSSGENSSMHYVKPENDYTGKWMNDKDPLREVIQSEIMSRKYSASPEPANGNDSVQSDGCKWTFIVKDGKTVRVMFVNGEKASGNTFWMLSDENAPMRCILIAPDRSTGPGSWKAAVRQNDSVYIDDFTLINRQYLVLVQRKNLNTSIEITDIYPEKKSGVENKINFPEPEGRISQLSYDKDEDKLVFIYSSIITPPTCYTYGIHSMHLGIRWKKRISNYNQEDYKAEVIRLNGSNNGGTLISVIRKRDMEPAKGSAPLLLFIETSKPWEQTRTFDPDLLSLLDRGFIVARLFIPEKDVSETEKNGMITKCISSLINGNGNAGPTSNDQTIPGNTLLIRTGFDQTQEIAKRAELITFVLASYQIDK